MAHTVFLSYASPDRAIADLTCSVLERAGIRVWAAPRDVLPGADYPAAITEAIVGATVFVAVYSQSYNESEHTKREVAIAFSERRHIIPLRIADVPMTSYMQYATAGKHWLDAITPPLEAHLDRLAGTVKLFLEQTQAAEPAAATLPTARRVPALDEAFRNPLLLVGAIAGAWILREPVGQGGSGIVFRAWQPRIAREGAVKLLRPAPSGRDMIGAALRRGARGLAALSHPGVVGIHDVGLFEWHGWSTWYLAMDFVVGERLDEWALEATPERKLRVALALARALDTAHKTRYLEESGFEQAGVLHGDIKPQNIIVRPGDEPVLLDFMIADVQRLLGVSPVPYYRDAPTAPESTWFGTPGYMAPEQERGGIVTSCSDVFSLGVTLRRLFSLPMDSACVAIRSVSSLHTLLSRMISRSPGERPTLSEVIACLSELAESRANARPPAGLWNRIRIAFQRWRRL